MDNPTTLIVVAGVIVFVLIINIGLISALRGKRWQSHDWVRGINSYTAGREAGEKQKADLDELHRRVAELRKDE